MIPARAGTGSVSSEAAVSVAAGSQKSRTHVCSYERNVEDLWISLQSAIPFRLSAHAPDLYNDERDRQAPTATERDGHTVRQTATVTDMAEDTVPQTLYANNGRCLRIHALWSPHMRCHLKQRVTNWQASFRSILAD